MDVYAYIIDSNIFKIYIKNNANRDIILQKRNRLGHITEYDIDSFFIVNASEYKLTARPIKYPDIKKLLGTILGIILPIFRNITEYQLPNEITVYGTPEIIEKLYFIVKAYFLL